MRETRVKPPTITGPALRDLHWVWKVAAVAALCLLLLIPLRYAYLMRTQHTTTITASRTTTITHDPCVMNPPTEPTPFTSASKTINPHGCDLVYAVVRGGVRLGGGGEDLIVTASTNVVGRRNYHVYRTAQAVGSEALMYYMWCPRGKGPVDGGWVCRS